MLVHTKDLLNMLMGDTVKISANYINEEKQDINGSSIWC